MKSEIGKRRVDHSARKAEQGLRFGRNIFNQSKGPYLAADLDSLSKGDIRQQPGPAVQSGAEQKMRIIEGIIDDVRVLDSYPELKARVLPLSRQRVIQGARQLRHFYAPCQVKHAHSSSLRLPNLLHPQTHSTNA